MKNFLVAVKAAYDGATAEAVALRAACTGGYHHLKAPQSTASPFLVSSIPGSNSWKTAGSVPVTFTRILLRFTVTSSSSSLEANEVADLVKALFSKVCLSGTGFSCVYCHLDFEKELDPAEKLWQYVIHYEVLLQQT